jgi:uncharacterized protein YcfJ
MPAFMKSAAIATALAFTLAACGAATPQERRIGGQVLGGVAGAAIGSGFGSGSGRTLAVATGAVLGAVAGGELADSR